MEGLDARRSERQRFHEFCIDLICLMGNLVSRDAQGAGGQREPIEARRVVAQGGIALHAHCGDDIAHRRRHAGLDGASISQKDRKTGLEIGFVGLEPFHATFS